MKSSDLNRLRWTIILTTLSFSLVPLLVLGVGINQKFSTAYQQTIQASLRTLLESKRNAIDLFLSERVGQLVTLANTESIKDLSNPAYLERVFNLLQSQTRYYIDLSIIGPDGAHISYAGPYQLMGVNYKNEDWFARVMAKGIYISDVFMGFRKHPHIIVAVLRMESGQPWIMRATIDSDVFESLVKRVQMGRNGDAFLVNSEHVLQTSPRFAGHLMQDIELPFSTQGRFPGVRVEDTTVNFRRFIYGWSWLDNKDWLLVMREDPDEELKPMFDAEYMVWLILLGGLLVICAGTVLVTNHMVNRLVRAEREKASLDANLTQSGKMAALGKMAAGVAHEINNPLAIIREQAGWIKDLLEEEDVKQSPNFKEINESVRRIEHHVERAKDVTHRMLGFARRMEPTALEVDLGRLVSETMKFLETEAVHRNIRVQIHLAPNLPPTASDPAQLQQVLLNLIDNAIDAIDKNGDLTITTACDHQRGEVSVSVSDTGQGIPQDKLDKIFDPFYTTKKPGEGTGLGLAISYGIIEKLGGRINVVSSVGHGSTFTVSLPISKAGGGHG